jgi:hypothetical protein
MNEQELRALVRQAVAYHTGGGRPEPAAATPAVLHRVHPSQALFTLPAVSGDACVVEPAVNCTHCGFCKTYGH